MGGSSDRLSVVWRVARDIQCCGTDQILSLGQLYRDLLPHCSMDAARVHDDLLVLSNKTQRLTISDILLSIAGK